jgi:hypothetical protein
MKNFNAFKIKFYKYLYKLSVIAIAIALVFCMFLISAFIYIGPYTTMKVKHDLAKNPVDIIVSLTTTPYRINTIKPVLDSIARQSIKPTHIYINIPWIFKRDNSEYIIPDWLKKYPNIIINRTKDYGPATKLIATLEKEHNPEAIIITIDDDRMYHRHIVRDLAKQYLPNTYKVNYKLNSAITGYGMNFVASFDRNFYFNEIVVGDRPSVLVVGTYGVAYKKKFFSRDIFSLMDRIPLNCFLSDDLMISSYLLANNIHIVKVSGISYNKLIMQLMLNPLNTYTTIDALSNGANGIGDGGNEINYWNCLFALPDYELLDYQQAILMHSKVVNKIYNSEIKRTGISLFFYRHLITFVDQHGWLKALIVNAFF